MARVTSFHGNWVADYRDKDGKRHREKPPGTFENKALQKMAAQELLAKRLREVEQGSYKTYTDRPTFGEVCARYIASKVNIRPTTLRSYQGLIDLYLRPYFGERKIHQISVADIERFRNELREGLPAPIAEAFARRLLAGRPHLREARARQAAARKKPGTRTINKTLTLTVMIFNYAARHSWVDRNPAEYVEKLKSETIGGGRPIDTNVLTPSEVNALLGAAEGPQRDRDGALMTNNYKLLLKVAVFTGMREGEILGAQWDDIDWKSKQLHVRRTWKEGSFHAPKTATSIRRVDLPDFLVSELREWRLACPKGPDELIFPNLEGRPLSHANLLQRGFYPALRRGGLRRIRFHDLRHTFASLLIASGEDVVRVSRLLGHASPNITLIVYSHMLPKEHYGSAERLATLVLGGAMSSTLVRAN
jgi:integrase